MDIGTQIGPYRIEALLGQGGMAEVYRALHLGLQRHEALKVLAPHLSGDEALATRFLREARTAASLQHPHIAPIHALSEPGSARPYFTMELVRGGDLADLLHARGRLSLEEARPLLEQIASALDYAHSRGVVHRDIKPGNILLTDERPRPSIRLVDFGIARAREDENSARLTQAGMIVGTPEYMSPEQANGAPIDARTDQYALGIVAYELLCGQPPFRAQSGHSAISLLMQHVQAAPRPPVEHVPNLPPWANAAILRALAKSREQRFGSCGEFVHALFSPPVFRPQVPGPNMPGPYAPGPQAPTMPVNYGQAGPFPPGPPRPPMAPAVQGAIPTAKPKLPVVPVLLGLALLGGGAVSMGLMQSAGTSPAATGTPASTTSGTPTRTAAAEPEEQWQTYRDAPGGWSIDVPAGWTQQVDPATDASRTVRFIAPTPHVGFTVSMSVPTPTSAYAFLFKEDLDGRLQNSDRYKSVSLKDSVLDGQPATRLEEVDSMSDVNGKPLPKGVWTRTVYYGANWKENRKIYLVSLMAPQGDFPAWQSVFDKAYGSFRFKGAQGSP